MASQDTTNTDLLSMAYKYTLHNIYMQHTHVQCIVAVSTVQYKQPSIAFICLQAQFTVEKIDINFWFVYICPMCAFSYNMPILIAISTQSYRIFLRFLVLRMRTLVNIYTGRYIPTYYSSLTIENKYFFSLCIINDWTAFAKNNVISLQLTVRMCAFIFGSHLK